MSQTTSTLGAAFRGAGPDTKLTDAELERELSERVSVARAVWPALVVTDREFAEFLAERTSLGELPATSHAADLMLACACAAGHHDAHTAFHRTYEPVVTRVLLRRGADFSVIDDVKQAVFEKLLLASAGARPRVADYRGVGPLKSWVATVAMTTLLMTRRSSERRREQSNSEDASIVDDVIESGPELGYLRQRFRKPVESAIVYALKQLGERDRKLMHLHVCERMSIDRIGEMYSVNRATAARWLASARNTLLTTAREEIRRGLGVTDHECDSILKLVHSQLDVSVARHLGG